MLKLKEYCDGWDDGYVEGRMESEKSWKLICEKWMDNYDRMVDEVRTLRRLIKYTSPKN